MAFPCGSPADPLQIRCLLTSSSCFLLLFFPQCPSHASTPCCCRGQGRSRLRQVSSRFLWDKGAFVCSAAEGTQPAALCPHLPPHHTHPRGRRVGLGNGEGFCQVSGSSWESGMKTHHQRNPDKKSIILLPGVVFQGGPGLGQGQALSRFCSVGFPGVFEGP